MLKKMIRLLVVTLVMCVPFNAYASDDAVKGMFVVVTSPDPQTQLMAMMLST